jgi:hypothetical protein
MDALHISWVLGTLTLAMDMGDEAVELATLLSVAEALERQAMI